MADATFDGANLYITLPNIGTFDTQTEIYSAWKEWVALSDNAKYPPAFDTTGGDSVGGGQEVAPYFFCRNDLGWRIKMPSANGEIVISGNLFPRSSSTSLFEATSGFDAFVRLEVSTRAVVVETGVSGLTAAESAILLAASTFDPTTDLLETGETYAEALRLIRAEAAGKLLVTGNTVKLRDANDTKDRIVAQTDSSGQRTSITTDGT
jgi:hypothetical protein